MKAFYRTTIALCLSMVVLFLTIGSATAANVTSAIEIRGPVYDGSDIDDIIDHFGDGTDLIIDATQFAAFSYDIDQPVINNTIKKGTFEFNITDVGKGTGEGTYNINTGTIKFNGTSITQGNFTGTYNINTKEGTITNTDLLGAISNFTATYDTITNELAINIADPNQLMDYPYVESDLSEGILVNNTVTEEIEENIGQAEPDSSVDVNATVSGLT